MKNSFDAVKDNVEDIHNKATGTWNKLEEVFQTRVARALRRMNVPTREDIQQLFEQVEILTRNIQELTRVEAEAKACKVCAVKSADLTEPPVAPGQIDRSPVAR